MTAPKFWSSACVPRISRRQAGADHHRELAGEDGQVFCAHRLGARLLRRLRRFLLDRVDLGDLDLLAPQRGDRRIHRVGDALAGHVLAGA
jgi:hypothetical protein